MTGKNNNSKVTSNKCEGMFQKLRKWFFKQEDAFVVQHYVSGYEDLLPGPDVGIEELELSVKRAFVLDKELDKHLRTFLSSISNEVLESVRNICREREFTENEVQELVSARDQASSEVMKARFEGLMEENERNQAELERLMVLLAIKVKTIVEIVAIVEKLKSKKSRILEETSLQLKEMKNFREHQNRVRESRRRISRIGAFVDVDMDAKLARISPEIVDAVRRVVSEHTTHQLTMMKAIARGAQTHHQASFFIEKAAVRTGNTIFELQEEELQVAQEWTTAILPADREDDMSYAEAVEFTRGAVSQLGNMAFETKHQHKELSLPKEKSKTFLSYEKILLECGGINEASQEFVLKLLNQGDEDLDKAEIHEIYQHMKPHHEIMESLLKSPNMDPKTIAGIMRENNWALVRKACSHPNANLTILSEATNRSLESHREWLIVDDYLRRTGYQNAEREALAMAMQLLVDTMKGRSEDVITRDNKTSMIAVDIIVQLKNVRLDEGVQKRIEAFIKTNKNSESTMVRNFISAYIKHQFISFECLEECYSSKNRDFFMNSLLDQVRTPSSVLVRIMMAAKDEHIQKKILNHPNCNFFVLQYLAENGLQAAKDNARSLLEKYEESHKKEEKNSEEQE